MVFLAFVEFAFISFVGIFISRMKYRDFVRVRTLRQMTRYMYSILSGHRKKKLFDIPVPSRDVTFQTLPGREL
jgi:hypothetical protein